LARVDYPSSAIDLAMSSIINNANPILPGEDTDFDITPGNLSSISTSAGIELTVTYDVQFSLNTAGNTNANCSEIQAGETLCSAAALAGNSSVNLLMDFTSAPSIPLDNNITYTLTATNAGP
jgi:hypothetical protein